jgi:hypothetical protein
MIFFYFIKKMMKRVIYGNNIYPIEKDLDSGFFDNLKECKDNKDIFLVRYEKSFKLILNDLEGVDFKNISEEELNELYDGLKYFMASEKFINRFKEKTCCNKALIKKIQKEIEEIVINGKNIYKNPNLSEEFIEQAIEKGEKGIYFEYLCENQYISPEFFQKIINNGQIDKIPTRNFKNCLVTEDDLADDNWVCLCLNPNLPVEFFEKLIKENKPVNWDALCCNKNIPFEFFKKALEENKPIKWEILILNPNVPFELFKNKLKEILEINKRDISYTSLISDCNFTPEFLEENFDLIINGITDKLRNNPYPDEEIKYFWWWLSSNKNISVEMIEKMIKKIKPKKYVSGLLKNPSIPVEFFERLLKGEFKEYIDEDWLQLTQNHKIPCEFFERIIKGEFGEIFDADIWVYLSSNPNLPFHLLEKAIEENKDVNWTSLSENPGIPVEFFEKNINKLHSLHNNPNLPLSFFKKHKKIPRKNIIRATILQDYFVN